MISELVEFFGEVHFVSLLVGVSLFIAGLITLRFPPKKINHVYGYRTRTSMKNQRNWDFAQKYATREMIRGGLIIITFALTGLIFKTSVLVDAVAGTALMVVIIVLLVARTEKATKSHDQEKQ